MIPTSELTTWSSIRVMASSPWQKWSFSSAGLSGERFPGLDGFGDACHFAP